MFTVVQLGAAYATTIVPFIKTFLQTYVKGLRFDWRFPATNYTIPRFLYTTHDGLIDTFEYICACTQRAIPAARLYLTQPTMIAQPCYETLKSGCSSSLKFCVNKQSNTSIWIALPSDRIILTMSMITSVLLRTLRFLRDHYHTNKTYHCRCHQNYLYKNCFNTACSQELQHFFCSFSYCLVHPAFFFDVMP